jgi:hypothetical protein
MSEGQKVRVGPLTKTKDQVDGDLVLTPRSNINEYRFCIRKGIGKKLKFSVRCEKLDLTQVSVIGSSTTC